jgi:hypothetical protein
MGILGGLLGGGGSSASSTTKQNTGTSSGAGSFQTNDSKVGNVVLGNLTDIRTADKYNVTANTDNSQRVNVSKGGTVNYTTSYNQTGGAGDGSSALSAISNLLSKITGNGSGSGGIVVGNTPGTGAASVLGASSNIRWGLIAAIAAAGLAVYFLFFRKKSA